MAFVNRAFNFTEKQVLSLRMYPPVIGMLKWYKSSGSWLHSSYPEGTMKPNNITLVWKPLQSYELPDSPPMKATYKFSDKLKFPDGAKGSGAVAQSSLMVGPDGSFMPAKEITRAEAIAALNK